MSGASSDESLPFSRWWLVAAGSVVIGTAGTYQFVWSSIRGPLGARIGAPESTLGSLFTVLVVGQTLAQFPAGWFRDRYGPRIPLLAGTVLLAGGYVGLAVASSPAGALVAIAAGSCGAGGVYTVALNTPVKWFRERRGLATGLVTMSYSGFSALLIPGIRGEVVGTFTRTMFVLGGLVVAVCVIGMLVLRDPSSEEPPATDPDDGDSASGTESADSEASDGGVSDSDGDAYSWREMLRTWQFWVLYVAFVIVNGVGLMLIGTSVAFARGLGLPAVVATATASIIAVANSGGGLVGGAVSDRLGETNTAGASLFLSGLGIAGAVAFGSRGFAVAFLGFVAAASFFRSPVFAVFPSLVGTYYGTARSSGNYAILYTAKIWGGVFGGTVTSLLVASLGWVDSFTLGAVLMALAGLATLAVRPVEGTRS